MVLLSENINESGSKYLVFTSAGDNAKLHHWLKGSRNFDLWVSYYGDEKNRYKDQSDFYMAKKGGKFPGLFYVYQHWKSILDNYQAILVLDDDVIIDGSAFSRLFEIREQYDLWLLQPAFNPIGKISHRITREKLFTFLRYTNFVEVTCPLFRKDKLDAFMELYDPVLVGYGIDYWYIDSLASEIKGKVAVVDAVSCINPHDWLKGGQRDIDVLQKRPVRIENWKKIKKQYKIQDRESVEFDFIKTPLSISSLTRTISILFNRFTSRCVKSAMKVKKRIKCFT